jgi:hypothetical protein
VGLYGRRAIEALLLLVLLFLRRLLPGPWHCCAVVFFGFSETFAESLLL